jgi:hypothetical protein
VQHLLATLFGAAIAGQISGANLVQHLLATFLVHQFVGQVYGQNLLADLFVRRSPGHFCGAALPARFLEQISCSISRPPFFVQAIVGQISGPSLVQHRVANLFVLRSSGQMCGAALLARSLEQSLCNISWPPFLVQQLLARSPGRVLCNIFWPPFWCSSLLAKSPGRIFWLTFLCRDHLANFVVQHCPPDSWSKYRAASLGHLFFVQAIVGQISGPSLVQHRVANLFVLRSSGQMCGAALLARSLEQGLCKISWPPFLVQQLLARSPGRILCTILWRTCVCSDCLSKCFVQHCTRT